MNKYKVVSGCYVPVGKGFRFKAAGQVITLSDEDAVLLADHITPVGEGVAKRNTEPEVVEPEAVEQPLEPAAVEEIVEEIAEGVSSDFRYPQADNE